MIMSFKVLKYFSSGQICFLLFACLYLKDLKREKMMFFFFEILTHTTAVIIEKEVLFPGKRLVFGWNLAYLEVNGIYK